MALINCPECDKKVSSIAEKCPNCSYPIISKQDNNETQTIELTSKTLKKQTIFAVLLLLVSFTITILGATSSSAPIGIIGLLGAVASIVWLIIIKFRTWWKHE